jgi:hypothetical protein
VRSANVRSPSPWTRRVLAIALAAAVAGGFWWALREREPLAGSAAPRQEVSAATPAASPHLVTPDAEPVVERNAPQPAPARVEERVDRSLPPEPARGAIDLLLRFTDPRRNEIELASGSVELRCEGREPRLLEARNAASVRFEHLPPGIYAAQVSAPGFLHRAQRFDLTSLEGAEGLQDGRAVFGERLVLWPDGWVAVVVRTSDGRSFEALAGELEMEPGHLFVDAFEARAVRAIPGPDSWEAVEIPPIAVFHKPPTYQAWQLPGSSVGSLQLLEEPPMWIGLALHGQLLGWEPLQRGATEIEFRLDADAFERCFASVALRTLDGSGAPLAGARATLKPDTSAHRRSDLADVESDADGRIAFARVIPGRAELSVLFGEALHQELLTLKAGEHRDLGDVELAPGAAVPIRVVDEEGRPVTAWIEIAPFREGQPVDELYPPNLHRLTGSDGEFRLPMPSSPSIVRARAAVPPRMLPTDDQSPNVLLDPAAPPREPLVLTVREPIGVTFELPAGEGFSVEVTDELGVLVVAPPYERLDEGQPVEELVPGNYRARLLDAERALVGETAFTLADAPQRVRLP